MYIYLLVELKKIKKKERTMEQNKLYQSLMKQQRKEKDRQRKATARANYSLEEKASLMKQQQK